MKRKVEVKHSQSKPAWNIIGVIGGGHHKWARIPYNADTTSEKLNQAEREKAYYLACSLANHINNTEIDR